MEFTHILLRYGELFLKGKNRHFFENRLAENIHKQVGMKVQKIQGRFILPYFDNHIDLKRVFGLTSYSLAVRVEKDIEVIKEKAIELVHDLEGTFRVETQRSDKMFLMKSPEINMAVGLGIEEKTSLQFAMKNSKYVLNIEINQDGAFLFLGHISCFGGLPVGVEGKVMVLVEDEASLLAGLMMMKRGCYILPVAFGVRDISLLQRFSPLKLELRRFHSVLEMEEFASFNRFEIITSGQNFDHYNKYEGNLTFVRPLIAYDDGRITEEINLFYRADN